MDEVNCNHSNFQQSKAPKLSTSIHESVNQIIKDEGYINHKVNIRFISSEGGSFMGNLFKVDITGETISGRKETNLFIKNTIDGEELKNVVLISDLYKQECFVYKELSKIYTEIQNEAHVPEEDRFKFPKGYKYSNSEGIIMENLSKRGYETYHRMTLPAVDFMELSIIQLAKFHALSFVVEKNCPEFFKREIFGRTSVVKLNEDWVKLAKHEVRLTIKCIDPELRKKAEKYTPTLIKKYSQYMNEYDKTVCCLCHGDYRMNNVMKTEIVSKKTAKQNPSSNPMENGAVTDVIPVDYQCIYWGSPIHDLIYNIFLNSDSNFRKLNLFKLKDLYYESFEKFLLYFKIKAEDVFPRLKFETVFKERLDYGLMIGLMYFCIIFAPDKDLPDLGSTSFEEMNFNLDSSTIRRTEEVIKDFIEWGYL